MLDGCLVDQYSWDLIDNAMRTLALLASLLATLVMGCASRYKLTLTNGNVITTKSKPKLDKQTGAYQFKNAFGKPDSVPGFRIKEMEPL
jgi:hypothetical protein